ncbi:hypothetical protein PRIPAC_77836 [Pristionchus pacificus]|uniref:Integrase zinc-binding domain-containing protein n=1 Tax=Pristionchus pacificus TaxID=54126 RepID=A0A2A6CIV5_PRIPA|nr:hypothetical protein PRIPAC_77836 [Pristionchus pacificus]|eukprot:PDM78164.1 hypothetical protein PRIPAC_30743 [Pristionchus pacificus]
MTSSFQPTYARLCALHSEAKQTLADFKSVINSFNDVDDFTQLEDKDKELDTALSVFCDKLDNYSSVVNKLTRRVEQMAIETEDQRKDKKKEIDIFQHFMQQEDEELDFDQVYLNGSFLENIRKKMSITVSNTSSRIKRRAECDYIRSITSIPQSHSTTIPLQNQSNSSDNSSQPSQSMQPSPVVVQNELITSVLSRIVENSTVAPLPAITLTSFDGESTQWESFHSQYMNMIHPRSHLSNHEKLVYLRNALKGAALRTVEGIPISNDRLDETIDRLKEVFGQSNRTNTILINQLLAIRPKSQSLEDQLECTQRFMNKVYQLNDKSVVDNFPLIHQIASTIHSKHLEKMFKQQPSTMTEALRIIETDLLERIQISNLKPTFRSHTVSDFPSNMKDRDSGSNNEKGKFKPRGGGSSNSPPCVYCGTHAYSDCPTITSIADRKAILKEKRLCFKCLSSKHLFTQCDRKCQSCSKLHHKSICDSNQKQNQSSIHTVTSSQPSHPLPRLYTSPATLQNPKTNGLVSSNVLLDSGAMVSLITRSLADKLCLKPHDTRAMSLVGLGGEKTGGDMYDVVNVNIVTTKGLLSIEAIVMDSIITTPMNLHPLSVEDYAVVQSHCGNVTHLTEFSITSPDLLISVTVTSEILAGSNEVNLSSGYKLILSSLGPIIIGEKKSHQINSNRSIPKHSILTSLISDVPFETRVAQYLSVDEAARDYSTTEAEARAESNHNVEQHFHDTVQKVGDQYQVQYYLKPESVDLPTNSELAYSRLKSTIHSLSKNFHYLEFYDSIMKEQLSAGMIEHVDSFIPTAHQCHYLAHQAVLRLDKPTTPLRIVIETHLKQSSNPSNEHLISQLINNVYVDNVIINTDQPTPELYSMSKALFEEMHMNLRDYASNSTSFIQSITESDRAPLGDQKLLGIVWNPSTDALSIRIPSFPRHKTETKRTMLSSNASIFDPVGLLQPLTLQAKSLVQKLWCIDLKWDQSVDPSIQSQFHDLLTDIESFHLNIPRYNGMSSSNQIHLVAFADASKLAMGAVIYVWTPERSTIVMSRSRLAPAKSKATIPKLELNALVMAHTLLRYIVDSIRKEFPTSIIHTHVYSDSAIALFWCLNDPNKKNNGTFVANRVHSIREIADALSSTPNVCYNPPKYVKTDSNPADHISRGLSASEMNNPDHMWWNGAPWMKDPPEKWPNDPIPPTADPPYTRIIEFIPTPVIDLDRCSTLSKAIRITGFVLRFIQKITSNSTNGILKAKFNQFPMMSTPLLSVLERDRALQTLIRNHQSCNIQTHDVWIQNGLISKDECDIWRASTRLDHADIPVDTRSPILIPTNRDSRLARLIITDIHEFMFHAGTENVLNQLKRQYWIPRSRQLVKSQVRSCIPCRKTNNLPYPYTSTPPLPSERVSITKPFQCTGIDFIGPFTSNANVKMYAVIFTCLSSRLSHIEVTDSLLPSAFINA